MKSSLRTALTSSKFTDDTGLYDLLDDNCKIEYGYDQPEQARQSAEEDMQQSWALFSRALDRLSGHVVIRA